MSYLETAELLGGGLLRYFASVKLKNVHILNLTKCNFGKMMSLWKYELKTSRDDRKYLQTGLFKDLYMLCIPLDVLAVYLNI